MKYDNQIGVIPTAVVKPYWEHFSWAVYVQSTALKLWYHNNPALLLAEIKIPQRTVRDGPIRSVSKSIDLCHDMV